MGEESTKYESPLKKQLEERLRTAPASYRDLFVQALQKLDHTDPREVAELLPLEVRTFHLTTAMRAQALLPMVKHAHEARCFIESLVISHGVALFSLRGLYVLAWQRAIMPQLLTKEQLAPYYERNTRGGAFTRLVDQLRRNEVISDYQASELRILNDARNAAAHGVIFGEASPAELERSSLAGLSASTRIVERFTTWFSNPQPLRYLPERRIGQPRS